MPGRCRFLVLSSLAILVVLFAPGAAVAQDATPIESTGDKSIEWTRFDVDLQLHADGQLHVTDRQEVAFHGGPFSSGFATIPLNNSSSVENVLVSEESDNARFRPYTQVASDASTTTPNTYRVQTDGEVVNVDWWYEPTTDASRTFVLEYDVQGALRTSTEDGDQYEEIWWIAIDSDVTMSAPVRSSTVTLGLPAAADPSRVLLSPEGYVPSSSGDWSFWTWVRTDLRPGDRFVVRLRFPAITLPAAATPSNE